MTDNLDVIERLLSEALDPSCVLSSQVIRIQEIIWRHGEDASGEAWELLLDLAYDLEFFEPDGVARREDAAFFGEERARELIGSARDRLGSLRHRP